MSGLISYTVGSLMERSTEQIINVRTQIPARWKDGDYDIWQMMLSRPSPNAAQCEEHLAAISKRKARVTWLMPRLLSPSSCWVPAPVSAQPALSPERPACSGGRPPFPPASERLTAGHPPGGHNSGYTERISTQWIECIAAWRWCATWVLKVRTWSASSSFSSFSSL